LGGKIEEKKKIRGKIYLFIYPWGLGGQALPPPKALGSSVIAFRYPCLFLLSVSTWLLWLLNAVTIHYPLIGNGPILNAFKNDFDRFLVFFACFENIIQHRKYVKSRRKRKKKKRNNGYDLKIFIIINAHKETPLCFLSMIQ
jgi:hypothetical protein